MPTKISLDKLQIGAFVTCKIEEAAQYSGYAGRPVTIFKPGMVGRVGAVKCPYVRENPKGSPPRGDYFACVDFFLEGRIDARTDKHEQYRVGLSYYNIVIISPGPSSIASINPTENPVPDCFNIA